MGFLSPHTFHATSRSTSNFDLFRRRFVFFFGFLLSSKGLDKGVMDALMDPEEPNTQALRRVIYVSCGFDALKRDAVALLGAGWVLRHSEGFVLFPGSDHVETLAIFDR